MAYQPIPVKTDDAAFTPGTDPVVPIGATLDDSGTDSVNEGDAGALRMSANRNLYSQIRDAAGNERGANVNSSNELLVAVSSLPSHAVTNAGTFATQVDGAALTSLQLIDDAVATVASAITSKGLAAAGTDGTNARILKTDSSGELQVDVLTIPALAAGTNNIGDVDVLSIAAGTNYIGKVRITDGTLDSSLVDETGSSAVDALAVGGGTPHDSVDSGNPVKIGFKALSALPTAVATADRANGIADLWGRQLVSHIDPAMQSWKSFNATTQQTGTDVWSPAGGKKIAITHIIIGTYGTTAGRLILWFGGNADTTYSEGTDQAIFKGSFAPSATVKPGAVISFATPVFAVTADHEVHCTTDAALSVDITLMGYEF